MRNRHHVAKGTLCRGPSPGHLGALVTWGPSNKHLLELEPVWFKVLLSNYYVQLSSRLVGGLRASRTPLPQGAASGHPTQPTGQLPLNTAQVSSLIHSRGGAGLS